MILVALALGGCGASRRAASCAAAPAVPKGDYGPEQPGSGERARPAAPPRKAPSAAVASALAAGTVGVVGVEGVVGVRPSTLDVSADAHARATCAGSAGAPAAPRAPARCACATATRRARSGGKDAYPATIRLSAPRLCGRATYFDRARDRARRRARRQRLTCVRRVDRPDELACAAAARRRGGRPRCPHIGHGERAICSRHQRHVHGSAACTSSAASRCTSTG